MFILIPAVRSVHCHFRWVANIKNVLKKLNMFPAALVNINLFGHKTLKLA